MKELSIEDKAKRYDEVIDKITDAVEAGTIEQGFAEWLFPELEESEDERIRKALIKYYSFNKDGGSYALDNITPKQILAWLEKQGGNRPAEWSEEDEINHQGILAEIEANKNQAPDYDLATYDRFLSWLKSLKAKYTWKPSDEQMASIACAVWKMKESACYDSELVSLFNDLKKLKVG